MILFLVTFRKQKGTFLRAIRAFIIHMGMTLVYSEALIAYIFQKKQTFERTNKFILNKMPSLIKNTYRELILGVWFFIGAGAAIAWGESFIAVALLLAAFALLSIYYVYWKILPTKLYSKKLLEPI